MCLTHNDGMWSYRHFGFVILHKSMIHLSALRDRFYQNFPLDILNGTIDCSCHNIKLGYVPSSLVLHMNHTDRQNLSSVLMVGPGFTCMSPERMIANKTVILAAVFFCGEFSFWRRFRFVSAQKDMDDIKWLTWWTGVNGSITFSLTLRMFTKHRNVRMIWSGPVGTAIFVDINKLSSDGLVASRRPSTDYRHISHIISARSM